MKTIDITIRVPVDKVMVTGSAMKELVREGNDVEPTGYLISIDDVYFEDYDVVYYETDEAESILLSNLGFE